jgi:hypothetical protein
LLDGLLSKKKQLQQQPFDTNTHTEM